MRFADLVEQKEVHSKLSKLVISGKIPHAILFSSLEGAGNWSIAYAFARLILCDNPVDNDACNVCPNCKKTQNFTHPDIFYSFPFVKKDSNKEKHDTCNDHLASWRSLIQSNPYPTEQEWKDIIDAKTKSPTLYTSELKDLHRRVGMRSYAGKKKILIMWMAEKMGKEANIVLKLLEEPPKDTLFFLLTENESDILGTIVSRCQRVFIPSPTTSAIVSYLERNNVDGLPIETLQSVAVACRRNMGMLPQLLSGVEDPFFAVFSSWLDLCKRNEVVELLTKAEEWQKSKARQEFIQFLNYGMELMRAMHIYAHNGPLPDLPKTESDFVCKFAKQIHKDAFQPIYQCFQENLIGAERNGAIKMVYMNMSIELNKLLNTKLN